MSPTKRSIGEIEPNKWLKHFNELLNPSLQSASMNFVSPLKVDEIIDSKFLHGDMRCTK